MVKNKNSASIFGPISLLKGEKYILSAENTDIDADNYKIDILESSVSSPFVEAAPNSAGDSPRIDAPLWIPLPLESPLPYPDLPRM